MAALPKVAAAEFSYIAIMFPETLEPKINYALVVEALPNER